MPSDKEIIHWLLYSNQAAMAGLLVLGFFTVSLLLTRQISIWLALVLILYVTVEAMSIAYFDRRRK